LPRLFELCLALLLFGGVRMPTATRLSIGGQTSAFSCQGIPLAHCASAQDRVFRFSRPSQRSRNIVAAHMREDLCQPQILPGEREALPAGDAEQQT
jgi:hypothetical protein